MQVNSLVVYIGGQTSYDPIQLDKNEIYTVSCICEGNFGGTWLPAIYLEETGNEYAFLKSMFKEVVPPSNINIENLIYEEQECKD